MNTNDTAAAAFIDALRNAGNQPPLPEPPLPTYAHITINRPTRCTIIFGSHIPPASPKKGA